MTSISTADPRFRTAVEACAAALGKLADYELEPALQRRLQELGERKEYLGQAEHDELMALVEFARKRTVEALEARLALQRLQDLASGADLVP